ncbi:MAG: hypothetical protein JST93_19610 [Acidobacteria bacterium]|nr:hypothetical protein [Acidobacteriota bacterium]
MNALFVLFLLTACPLPAQGSDSNRDPEKAVIVTSDVALFWKAYDSWSRSGAQPDRLQAALQTEYLNKASDGVKDFTPDRIISAEALAARILEDRAYYDRVRPNTEKAATMEHAIRDVYRKFQKLYPEAVFPALYIVIGRRNSGGMSSPRALILGAEMFAGEGARLKFEDLIPMVAHELVHFQQNTDPSKAGLLFGASMREGGADFIAEITAGRHINEAVKSYGDSHEHELWAQFQQDIEKPDRHRAWLYNGRDPNRVGPPDLGYYMGYKICQSYYQAATNRKQAFRNLVKMDDPATILKLSRYPDRFAPPSSVQ